MKCKICPSTNGLEDNDPLYSSYRCLDCGYYYREEGQKEVELIPYCLLILNDSHYETITTRSKLLIALRILRKSSVGFDITLRKYSKGKYLEKELIL